MAIEIKAPAFPESVADGSIATWHKQPGEAVSRDELLVDIETDKAAVTIPSPRGGTVEALKGKVGDIVNVGDVVVVIDDGSAETVSEKTIADQTFAEPAAPAPTPVPEAVAPAGIPGVRRPVPAAPATRRLARELKIDVESTCLLLELDSASLKRLITGAYEDLPPPEDYDPARVHDGSDSE